MLELRAEGTVAEMLQGTGHMPRGGGPAAASGRGRQPSDFEDTSAGEATGGASALGAQLAGADGEVGEEWVPRFWVLRRCVLYSYRSPLQAVPWEGLPLSDVVGLGRAPASVVGEGRAGI